MVQSPLIKFLSKLKKNNHKAWLDENRKLYESVKSDFILMADALIKEMSAFDRSIAFLKAKDCIFRINRDIRFSKNKSPYKTNMAAYFNRGGKKGTGAGYYLHLEPGNCFLAAGVWMPEADELNKIRQEIDYNFEEWEKILHQRTFKKYFPGGVDYSNSLVRPPKGYAEDNPAIEYLKLKSFVAMHPLSESQLTEKNFVRQVSTVFETAFPLVSFINRALD